MSTPVSSIRNLGPAVESALARAGVPDAETLREIGAHEAYGRMLKAGTKPHFIGYYVMHMALQGRPWNDCRGKEKEELRARFDALCAEVSGSGRPLSGIEKVLDEIGVRPKAGPRG